MIKEFLFRVFCGFFLGVSIFAPGFSGSVVAIIMGVYQDMLRIVANPFKRFKENVIFCIPLGIGALISAVLFIISFKYLFDKYEKATYLLFIGLIAGNLPIIYDEIKSAGFKKRYLIGVVCAFAAALALGLFAAGFGVATSGKTAADTPLAGLGPLPQMALSGFAGGITAFIPGMSVSMVLIIMGAYNRIITIAYSLLRFDLSQLPQFAAFCVCAVVGIVLASRLIKTVFEKYPGLANSLIFGFMAGSLIGVLISCLRMNDANFNWLFGALMLAAGLGASMLFVALGRAMKNLEK